MPPIKVLARGWKFHVRTAVGTPDIFTAIKGINSFSFDPAKNDADTTDFDSNGFASHVPASRSYSITLDGFHIEDTSNGTRDPGQAAVEAVAALNGTAGVSEFRMVSPGGKIREFDASVNVTGPGGGNDDLATWSVALTVSGEIRYPST